MLTSTHRLRNEEKRLLRKLVTTIGSLVIVILLIIYIGLPVLAKVIIILSSFRRDNSAVQDIQNSYLFPPVLEPVSESTKSSTINLSGSTTKNTDIKILVNGESQIKTTSDDEGKFKLTRIKLQEGVNNIQVISYKVDKQSNPTSVTINYIKNPPKLEVNSPKDGDQVRGENRDINIEGNTDPENRIFISDRQVIVDIQGNFSYQVTLSVGDNTFKIRALDTAGSSSEIELQVKYSP